MTAPTTFLDFLRAGSPLHRVVPAGLGFAIVPAGADAAAREAFQAVAEVAVEQEGQGYRIEDVRMSEAAGGYEEVAVTPLQTTLRR